MKLVILCILLVGCASTGKAPECKMHIDQARNLC